MSPLNSNPLLEGRDISKAYAVERGILRKSVGFTQALSHVSFEIAHGEALALVGGSGCGKSTLAKIMTGLIPPDTGTLTWEGSPFMEQSREVRARKIQMIFQDPYASLNPKLSIGTQLREVCQLGGTEPHGLLASVGLEVDALTHYPFQFSGGQRQRIAIARALALQPRLLIADEPLSALDVTTQAQILELLQSLREKLGLTMLLITHDLAVADMFADRMIVLKEGHVVEQGAARTVLQAPQHEYTRALVEAIPKIPWSR